MWREPQTARSQAATTARYLACTKRAFTEEGWLLLAGPVALAVLASAGWLAAPAVLTRWRAVVSIRDGPVRSALDALACESGERRAPQWCTGSGADAWTFGRSPSYRVVLARAMVRRMLREGPASLRAVVLHELSAVSPPLSPEAAGSWP